LLRPTNPHLLLSLLFEHAPNLHHKKYTSQFYAPWKCEHERHTYEKCQHEEYKLRVALKNAEQ
jgi:hypothetical protein